MLTMIDLGRYVVHFGISGDSDRVKKLIGQFPHQLGERLGPEYFGVNENDPEPWCWRKGIAGWPEGDRQVDLVAAIFSDQHSSYKDIQDMIKIEEELAELQQGSLPHLLAYLGTIDIKKVRTKQQRTFPNLVAPDVNSLWRSQSGLHTMELCWTRNKCFLTSSSIVLPYCNTCFLFARE